MRHDNNSDNNNSDNNYSDNNYSDNNYSDNNYSDNNYSDNNYSDNNYSDNNNAPENSKLLALQESATSTLASLKSLALQFRQHQALRRELETSLVEALKENNGVESPEIIVVASQISELTTIETAIIEGLRLIQSPEANIVRGQALLVPLRSTDETVKGGSKRNEDGFYFPRR